MKNQILSNHITSYQVTAPNIPSPSRKKIFTCNADLSTLPPTRSQAIGAIWPAHVLGVSVASVESEEYLHGPTSDMLNILETVSRCLRKEV